MDDYENKIQPYKPLRKCISRIKKIPVFLPTFIGVILFILSVWANGGDLYKESTFGDWCLFFCLLLMSLTGVLAIIHREVPRLGLPSIKGWVAVVEGVFFAIVTTIAWLVLLVELIK